MNRKLLYITLFAFAVSSLGFSVAAYAERDDRSAVMEQRMQKRIEHRVKFLTETLELTPEQAEKFTAILAKSKDELRELRKQMRDKIKKAREETDKDLNKVLTKEQQKIFTAIKKTEQKARKARMKKGGKAGKGGKGGKNQWQKRSPPPPLRSSKKWGGLNRPIRS
ncbi:hypothetical protein ACFLRA_02235 [Bdellovibrionota bacterium]